MANPEHLAKLKSPSEPDPSEMARHWYGHGRWDYPYWFIGPEPGQARSENHDFQPRLEAWRHSGAGELCDCQAFHDHLSEKRWHGEKPRLQPTWRPLILLLMTFLGRPCRQGEPPRLPKEFVGNDFGRWRETCYFLDTHRFLQAVTEAIS